MGWRIYGGVGACVALAYYWLPPSTQNLWYDAVSVSVVIALLFAARASHGSARVPWLLFALAQACYSVADIIWNIINARYGSVPLSSPLDAVYFAYYPLAALGLILLLRKRRSGRELDAATDALIAGTAVAMVMWVLLLPLLREPDLTMTDRSVSLGYPAFDLVLLVLTLRLAIGTGRRCISFRLLVASLVITTVADLAYAVTTWRGEYDAGGVVDVLWLLGYLAFGVAALHPSRSLLTEPGPTERRPMRRRRVGLLAAAGLLPPAVLALVSELGEQLPVAVFVLGSTVLYLLVLARVVGVVRQQEQTIHREQVLREAGRELVAASQPADVERSAVVACAELLGPGYVARLVPDPSPGEPGAGSDDTEVGPDGLVVPLATQGGQRGALVIDGPRPVDAALRVSLTALATEVALAAEAVAQEEERRRSERRFRSIVYASSDLMFITEPGGIVTWCADSVERICGYRSDELVGTDIAEYTHPEDATVLEYFATAVQRPDASARADCRMRLKDGSYRVFQVTGRNLLGDPAVAGLIWTGLDVTERRELEDQLRGRAFHDPLTGLANRALFLDRLEHSLAGRAGPADTAVLFVDLDDFKTVNDSLGHDAGDDLLKLVGHRILALLRPSDTAARFGGDEFAVLVEDAGEHEAVSVADRILATLAAPFDIADREVFVRASIGVAVYDGMSDANAMLRNADIAMYRAKATGKSRHDTFRPGMHADALRRLELHGDLQRALDRSEFRAFYQPIVDLTSGRIVGFEALLRWQHPTQGLLAPGDFIPLAEESGLIVPLGRWVLDTACRQARVWQERFDRTLTMAVNLSARQMGDQSLLAGVDQALTTAGLDPTSLTLELTENAFVADVESTTRTLKDLRATGVRIAIDDFGTGYSSLAYLEQFPVDVLKIDRSFVMALLDPTRAPTLVSMIVELARSLGAATIAEGIEEREQLRQLRDLGCLFGQGFLFARPMPAEEIERTLASGELQRFALVSAGHLA